MTHRHVAVFHGPREAYNPGLVLHRAGGRWEVIDETGQLGPPGLVHGVFSTEVDACREALRLLRARLAGSVVPCWGAGAPNAALRALGYARGELRWRWWPPRLERVGESVVGADGRPVPVALVPRTATREVGR